MWLFNRKIVSRMAAIILSGLLIAFPQISFSANLRDTTTRTAVSKHSESSALPRITVTDLSYEEKVTQHFVKYDSHSRGSGSQSSSGGAGGYSGTSQSQAEHSEHLETGSEEIIDRGELRKFTADVKGEMIKSRLYRVVQGKPWVKKDTDNLYDVIGRIKEGYYPNSDFVLFGTVSSVDIRNESNPIQGSNAINYSLTVELMVEFSLINTKTYEVVAAFSARGEGSDAKLVNISGTSFKLSRSKAMSEMSHALGDEAAKELINQFSPQEKVETSSNIKTEEQEKVITFQ
jgi:hypothetical protein